VPRGRALTAQGAVPRAGQRRPAAAFLDVELSAFDSHSGRICSGGPFSWVRRHCAAAIRVPGDSAPPGRADPGTGIGLAVAAELTRAHGGRLTGASVPGQGTAMTLTLPRT
jgi:two-component system, OmpR family, sensor kinase